MDEIKNGKLVGTYPGTLDGSVSLVQGKVNKALYTNGINQWVNIGKHRDECLGNLRLCSKGYVMALWLKVHIHVTSGSNEYYINNGGHTQNSMGMSLHQKSVGLCASFRTLSKLWFAVVPDFESLMWYHIVMTWTEEGGLRVYMDGCLRQKADGADSTNNQNPSTTDFFVFGNANTDLSGSFAGEMTLDDVRVWDADMNGEDVWKIYLHDIFPS